METSLTMRSFTADPLSVNRLRQSERDGEVLLRRPLMQPSTSSEFCEQVIVTTKTENGNDINGFNQYNTSVSRFSDCTETYPAPPSQFCTTIDEQQEDQTSPQLQQRHIREEETDIEDEIARSCSKESYLVPSKSQVLFYLSRSKSLKILHTGCELQVTDSSDFPLLDIWAEAVCCAAPVWIIESYGRRVLALAERDSVFAPSTFLPRIIANLFSRRRRVANSLSVIDWNGDVIGFFIPGDPFIIQNNVRTTIARCTRIEQQNDRWQCLLESNGREVARMESDSLQFSPEISFQLKLLAIAALARATGRPKPHANCFPFLR